MSARRCLYRFRWMTLLTLCGALLTLTVPVVAAEQPIGTVVGVPASELDGFIRANAFPGNDTWKRPLPANSVTVLHIAPEFNSAIVTVGVTRRSNGQPAESVYFPTFGNEEMSGIYRRINADDVWTFAQRFGEGYNAVMKVDITQPYTGTYTPGVTRFLIVPWESVAELKAVNPRVKMTEVHRQRAHVGGGDRIVQLLAIHLATAAGGLAAAPVTLQIPNRVYGQNLAGTIRNLNSNVAINGVEVNGSGTVTTIEIR